MTVCWAPKCGEGHAGGQRNLVADLDGGHLIVAGQNGGAGKDLDVPHFLDGAQGGGEIVADDGVNARAGKGGDAGGRAVCLARSETEQAGSSVRSSPAWRCLGHRPSTPMSTPLL